MKEITIHDIRAIKRLGDGVYKHIVHFELKNTNIVGKYVIKSDTEMSRKEIKRLISKEIYGDKEIRGKTITKEAMTGLEVYPVIDSEKVIPIEDLERLLRNKLVKEIYCNITDKDFSISIEKKGS